MFSPDTATTKIYTLSLHDALPISPAHSRNAAPYGAPAFSNCARQENYRTRRRLRRPNFARMQFDQRVACFQNSVGAIARSEEHTSELQSLRHLVCRLLLEKKKKKT